MTVECALVLPLFLLSIWTIAGFMEIYQIGGGQLALLCDQAKELGVYAYQREECPEITLSEGSFYKSPLAMLPLPQVEIRNQVTVHSWVGYRKDTDGIGAPQEMVYVTEHGGVYHTKNTCTHLRLSIRQEAADRAEELRNRYQGKYHPCERCCGNGETPDVWIYITETGNRYHSRADCSGLKRTVRLISKKEIKGLPACKKCGGEI